MKSPIVLAILITGLAVPRLLEGAACCIGGSPKSFISLQRLQSYELGMSTSARNVYGRYNLYGNLEEADRNQTLTLAFGAGARLTHALSILTTFPVVYQVNSFGRNTSSRASVGDILVGGELIMVDSLFEDDWYPTIALTGGLKLPTGTTESFVGGRPVPGTGNGLWEPYFGLSLRKHYGGLTLSVQSSYSWRAPHDGMKDGDSIDLIESVAYAFTRRLSIAAGATQNWVLATRRGGQTVADTASRVAGAFIAPSYFVSRFWQITAILDASLPVAGMGINQQASQAITVTTRYGFF